VTFILQKQGAKFPGFASWYAQWQDRMRADPVLTWLVRARNKVVKEGDLETCSKAHVAVVDSWFERATHELEVPPLTPTEEVAAVVAATKPQGLALPGCLLRVERRWIDENLPGRELLEALGHVFGELARLLIDAHERLLATEELSVCDWYAPIKAKGGRLPPCMVAQEWDRTVWVDLTDGARVTPARIAWRPSRQQLKAIPAHYAGAEQLKEQVAHAADLRGKVDGTFRLAKLVLQTDGYHDPIAIVGYPDRTRTIQRLGFVDRAAKALILRRLAAGVAKTGATSVILVNEAWFSPLARGQHQPRPGRQRKRREMLLVVGAQADGSLHVRAAFFHKDRSGAVTFDEEADIGAYALPMLEPFRQVWRCNWVPLPPTP